MLRSTTGGWIEPNHLQRCLDLLETLPQLDEQEGVGSWLAAQDAESAALPLEARHRLFDEWFAGAYAEEPAISSSG